MKNLITPLVLIIYAQLLHINATSKPILQQHSIGLGMAKPDFYNNSTLYFYSPNLQKSPQDHTPMDSLVFTQTEIGYSISYAPPWFYPAHLKMDYEIIYLKVISMTHDWLQVEVNQQTHLTHWIASNSVKFIDWPTFLLQVSSVELSDNQTTLKQKPLDHAAEFSSPKIAFLRPVAVRDRWLQVEVLDSEYNVIATGIWLQWRDGDKLLISYSLLS